MPEVPDVPDVPVVAERLCDIAGATGILGAVVAGALDGPLFPTLVSPF